jgi:hypothetical protein
VTARQGTSPRVPWDVARIWAWHLGPAVAAVIAAAGALARQTGIPTTRTIWAEDGQTFAQCAYTAPSFVHCLLTPYDAWLQVVPRLLAQIATLVPPMDLSYALSGLAAIVAAACGYLTARAVRDVTRSTIAGSVAGAALLLVLPAGREVGGNITNVHWILFATAVTLIVATWLDHRFDLADGLLIGLLVWSTPFSLVLAALALLGVLFGRRRLAPIAVVAAVAAVVQVCLALTASRIAVPDLPVGVLSPIGWYSEVIGSGIFGNRGPIPDWLMSVGVVAVIVGLAIRAGTHRRPGPVSVWWATPEARAGLLEFLTVAAIVVTGLAVFAASTYLNRHVAARYVYVPAALTVIALFMGAGLLVRHAADGRRLLFGDVPAAKVLLGVLALVVAVGFATSFRIGNGASAGPDARIEIASARRGCGIDGQTVSIRISPLPTAGIPTVWHVLIPCDRFQP